MEGLPCLTKLSFALPPPSNAVHLSLPQPTAQRYYVWAEKLFEFHRYKEALDAYNECLEINPSNVDALYKRGLTKGLLKNMECALDDLSSVSLQRFLKEARVTQHFISEIRSQEFRETDFLYAVPNGGEFFEAVAEFEELNKSLHEAIENLFEETSNIVCDYTCELNERFCGMLSDIDDEGSTAKEKCRSKKGFLTKKEHPSSEKDPRPSTLTSEHIGQTETFHGQITKMGYFIPHERFSHVQGLENAKSRLMNNVVLPMKRPDLFSKYKKRKSFTVLLYGPPGCGKTLIVRALAGESGSYVVLAKLHELMDMWKGNSEKNIHAVFEDARRLVKAGSSSCIVFLDELDSVGVNRGFVSREPCGSHRDMVNQLLMELDGVERNPEGLFVIAASNRPWDVDPALKRSGRIGECIYIPPPSYEARKQLFIYYVGSCTAGTLGFNNLAKATEGCSAADIECIVEEAKMHPILREHQTGVESSLRAEDFMAVLADPVFGKGTPEGMVCLSSERTVP